MPDWALDVRARLASLRLSPTRSPASLWRKASTNNPRRSFSACSLKRAASGFAIARLSRSKPLVWKPRRIGRICGPENYVGIGERNALHRLEALRAIGIVFMQFRPV